MKLLILFAVCAALGVGVDASQGVMKDMTAKFSKALNECKQEHNLPDSVGQDLMNFWKEDYVISDRATGCAIVCLSAKLDLHDNSGKINEENCLNFAKAHGADEATAKAIMDIVVNCETDAVAFTDPCIKMLEIAKCFKAGIHKLNWAPSMDMVAEV